MIRRYAIATGLAAICAVVSCSAQTQEPPAGSTPQRPVTQAQPSTDERAAMTTLVGCVYKEQNVPGRTPNIAERAGVLEDYILAQAEPEGQSGSKPTASGVVGTSGLGKSMYKLEKVSDEQLRALVGKRVEVTGKMDAEPRDTTAQPTGTAGAAPARDKNVASPDEIELPEFEVVSIRAIEGTCPATPSVR